VFFRSLYTAFGRRAFMTLSLNTFIPKISVTFVFSFIGFFLSFIHLKHSQSILFQMEHFISQKLSNEFPQNKKMDDKQSEPNCLTPLSVTSLVIRYNNSFLKSSVFLFFILYVVFLRP